jgi:hypothetical protein
MPHLTPPDELASPPPGLCARLLDEPATLERLLRHVPDGADDVVDPALFARLGGRSVRAFDGEGAGDGFRPVDFPLPATNAGYVAAMFSIPLEQAWALLPATERLVPVRVTPRRAAISFFAWQVRRGAMGAYHELGVGLPVLLDAPKPPSPLPPALWRDPALGLYAVELPVDAAGPAEIGTHLSGLPHVLGSADVAFDARGARAHFAYDGRRMADLAVGLGRWPRLHRHDVSYQSYSLREGRIVRMCHTAVGEGYRGRRGHVALGFGEHRRAQRLARLELSRRPLEVRVLPRMNWIAWGPEDAGPI